MVHVAMTSDTRLEIPKDLGVLVDLNDDRSLCGGEYYCHLLATFVVFDEAKNDFVDQWRWGGDSFKALTYHVQGDTQTARSNRFHCPLYPSCGGMELGSRGGYIVLTSDQVGRLARYMAKIDREVERVYREQGSAADLEWRLIRWIRATGSKYALFRGREFEPNYVKISIDSPQDIAMRVRWLWHAFSEKYSSIINPETAQAAS